MKCLSLRDGKIYEVFDIAYDSDGFPTFLIYKAGQWIRQSAKHFTPNFYEDGNGGYTTFY